MKVICDCGAVIDLIEDVDDECESEYGTYVTESSGDIRFWEEHDIVGIVCERCKKAVWTFV